MNCGLGCALGGQLAAGEHGIRSAPSILPPSYMVTKAACGVAEVVILRVGAGGAQVDGRERNGLAQRILAAAGDIGAAGDQHGILEEIVRRAVLLKDDHHVLDHGRRRQGQRLRTVAGSRILGIASGNGDGVVAAGSAVEVDTVSVEVPGLVPLIVTADGLNEHVGAGVPPVMLPHERLTLPV